MVKGSLDTSLINRKGITTSQQNGYHQVEFPLIKEVNGRKNFIVYGCKSCSKDFHNLVKQVLNSGKKKIWTYYGQKTNKKSPNYSLPNKGKETAQEILQNSDLSQINTWKKVFVTAPRFTLLSSGEAFKKSKEMYKEIQFRLLDKKYMLFSKDFFEKTLNLIHKQYLGYYNQKKMERL